MGRIVYRKATLLITLAALFALAVVSPVASAAKKEKPPIAVPTWERTL